MMITFIVAAVAGVFLMLTTIDLWHAVRDRKRRKESA